MPQLSKKWQSFGTSIFSVMTQKALAAGAVNLAQGFPDFDGPEAIKTAACKAVMGSHNQYAPAAGLPELRRLLAQRQQRRTGLSYDWDSEVTIFSGATEALYCAMQALFEPGDEILAFEPFYDSYPAAAHSSGARIVGVPLTAPDFAFSAAALAAAVTPRTKAMIVNTPHNPTGRVLTLSELTTIRDLAVQHDLLVITDEVYEELVYDGATHVSLATLPGMVGRTIVISSTAKTYSFTGWKVGYSFAPPALTALLRTVHQFTVFCSATPLQVGMMAALQLGDDYYTELRAEYDERRRTLVGILSEAGFRVAAPLGTYFVLADYSQLADSDDLTFAAYLTDKIKVAAIPISRFYSDPAAASKHVRHVRFAFCKGLETLRLAQANLRQLPRQ